MNIINTSTSPTIFCNPPATYGNTSGTYSNITLNNSALYAQETAKKYWEEVDKRFTYKITSPEGSSGPENKHSVILWTNNTNYSITIQIKLANGYIFDFSISREVFVKNSIPSVILIEYIVRRVEEYSANDADIEYLINELNRLFNNQNSYKAFENYKNTLAPLSKPKKSLTVNKSSNKQLELDF